MKIRAMEKADLAAVLALTRLVPEAPWWSEEHIRQIVDREETGRLLRRGWVVAGHVPPYLRDGVHGFIVLQALQLPALPESALPQNHWECQIESIVVDPEFRRRGLGGRLLVAALNWCRGRNADIVRLEVRSQNTPAIQLYGRAGFSAVGRRAGYYHSPLDDALLMEIRLPAAL
jgi:ribosomal protein S18 acetylase RimI-like enzyme